MWMDPAQGRWVCVRCFESNEATADRCVKCGLERGADPAANPGTSGPGSAAPGSASDGPPPESGALAPGVPARPWAEVSQPQSQRPGWMQLVLRFWWVGLLVIGGGIAAVSYLGGSRPITDITVGDCFDVPDPNADVIDDVTKRECTDPHQYEMFFVGDLPDGPFPSDTEVGVWLDANCLPAFTDYVGIAYDESTLVALPITPTEDGWNDGDHSVQCAMQDPADPELTESLEGAAR